MKARSFLESLDNLRSSSRTAAALPAI